jgi:uncharacterized protein YjiS (DUF1127 family)
MSEPQPTEEEWRQVRVGAAWIMLRRERKNLLSDSDWTQGIDSPLSSEKKAEWLSYRQALRDLPSTVTDPTQVVWPTPPS